MHQERHYPGPRRRHRPRQPRLRRLARAFGAHGALVERTEDVRAPRSTRRSAAGRPALLELRVDPRGDHPRQTLDEIREAAAVSRRELRVRRAGRADQPLRRRGSRGRHALRLGHRARGRRRASGRRRRRRARRAQVFAIMGRVLAAAGASARRRRQGHGLPARHRRPPADQPGARGVLRRDAAGQHARRGQPPGGPRRAAGGGGDRAPAVAGAGAIAADVEPAVRSAEEFVAESLARLEARRDLNAVITLCADERAGARADRCATGRLAGVPLLVKDLIDTAGVRTTYGSAIYPDHVPARTRAGRAALEAEGAIVVGKANADEFAWGVCGQNAALRRHRQPASRPDRIAGGSSCGNAAALAAGLVPLALGTDTGGSVRMPAAACGVSGSSPRSARSRWRACSRSCRASTRSARWRAPSPTARSPTPPDGRASRPAARRRTARGRADRSAGPGAGGRRRAGSGIRRRARRGGRPARAGRARPRGPPARAGGRPWAVFYGEAARSHARDSSPAAATSTARHPGQARSRDHGAPEAAEAGAARAGAWRVGPPRQPDVDLIVSPTLGVAELPPAGADELEFRLAVLLLHARRSTSSAGRRSRSAPQLAGRDTVTDVSPRRCA